MNFSLNGHSNVPPGFRFHPTEEELLQYYLQKKISGDKIDLDVIRDVDLNKLEPWDIQDKCKIGSTPQNDWYFFSHKDKKYPTGTRTNRATAAGFWKATGRDKVIYSNFTRIGMRKTLVFYGGRAPHGQKSDWIMHEYRLEDNKTHESSNASNVIGEFGSEEGWVVCRVFKKKNYQKGVESPSSPSILPWNDSVVDHILMCMESSSYYKPEKDIKMPFSTNESMELENQPINISSNVHPEIGPSSDWGTLDRLVAYQLNGQSCTNLANMNQDLMFPYDDQEDDAQLISVQQCVEEEDDDRVGSDLWDLSRTSASNSDPLCHLSI